VDLLPDAPSFLASGWYVNVPLEQTYTKPRLPAGYRAYIGTTPTFAIAAPAEQRPDLGVRDWAGSDHTRSACAGEAGARIGEPAEEPNEKIAVETISGDTALLVEQQGRLIAAIELVSPRNNDRPSALPESG
jgi:hypothetical protein